MFRPSMQAHRPSLRFAVVTAFALLLVLGPLGLLQIVAWTGMALDYSTRYGLATGLQRTFDGEHPCQLCTKITQVRQEQAESPAATVLPPVKMVCVEPVAAHLPASPLRQEPHEYFIRLGALAPRSEAPPSPPPRTLAA
jgi:hypothetical protein